jgi:hypothetical protein
MFKLNDLRRADENTLHGLLTIDDHRCPFSVKIDRDMPVRGMSITSDSQKETVALHHRPEFRSFCRMVWAFIDGRQFTFPAIVLEE